MALLGGDVRHNGKAQSLYLDGAPNNSRTSTAYYGGSGELDIGRYLPSTNGYFNGYLNEVRVEEYGAIGGLDKTLLQQPDASFVDIALRQFGRFPSAFHQAVQWRRRLNLRIQYPVGHQIQWHKGRRRHQVPGPDTVIGHNQLDTGLFCVRYNGHESDTGAGTISMLTAVRFSRASAGEKRGRPAIYNRLYRARPQEGCTPRVTTLGTATTASTAGLAFRIKNASTTHYRTSSTGQRRQGARQ